MVMALAVVSPNGLLHTSGTATALPVSVDGDGSGCSFKSGRELAASVPLTQLTRDVSQVCALVSAAAVGTPAVATVARTCTLTCH